MTQPNQTKGNGNEEIHGNNVGSLAQQLCNKYCQ